MKRTPIAIAILAAVLAAQPAITAAQAESKIPQPTMDHMKEMQAQMDKIYQTADPKEREKLMAEHIKSMQEGMRMMRGMGGDGMGMMGGGGQGMSMMEGRMDIMQMMMEQMLQHQQMMQQAPEK